MGHFFSDTWFLKNRITPTHILHLKFLKRLLGVNKGTDTHCVDCSAKQVRCPFVSNGSDASYDSGTVHSLLLKILFLRKLCGLTFLLQIKVIHGLIRSCTHSLISLRLSNFGMPYSLSTQNSSSSLCANVSSGSEESLTISHHMIISNHMIITLPAELWGFITHNLMYLPWELFLAGGMTEKDITSLCYLSTFAWIFSEGGHWGPKWVYFWHAPRVWLPMFGVLESL